MHVILNFVTIVLLLHSELNLKVTIDIRWRFEDKPITDSFAVRMNHGVTSTVVLVSC